MDEVHEISKKYQSIGISPCRAFAVACEDYEAYEKGMLDNPEIRSIINKVQSDKRAEEAEVQAFVNKGLREREEREQAIANLYTEVTINDSVNGFYQGPQSGPNQKYTFEPSEVYK